VSGRSAPGYAVLLATAVAAAACFSGTPERTGRPALQVAPWAEREVRSAESGHTHSYLFLEGPEEGAPALLLLHGGIFDNRIWLNTAALAERFHLYALRWPDVSLFYSGHIEDYGEIAADFLGALGIDRAHVAGVSLGAFAAVDFVSRKKEIEVPALFLLSSVMYGVTEEEIDERTAMARRALGFAPDRLRNIIEWRVGRTTFDRAEGPLQQDDIFYIRPYPYYFQIFSQAVNQGPARQATGAIDCPVLFLVGTEDETMPVEVARLGPSLFTDAELYEHEGGKHSMVFSDGPALAARMLEFLERRRIR
jgi:pimeloyl-ACP methyl ester carboxylesterase